MATTTYRFCLQLPEDRHEVISTIINIFVTRRMIDSKLLHYRPLLQGHKTGIMEVAVRGSKKQMRNFKDWLKVFPGPERPLSSCVVENPYRVNYEPIEPTKVE